MWKRTLALALLFCCLLLLPAIALATEGSEDDFISPTRDPNAPEYDTEHPSELVPEQIVARSFLLIERKTGNVLYERNADLLSFPASTTKIMTALIALQSGIDLQEKLTISPEDNAMPDDASMVPFKDNEEVTLQDALYGLLLRSGNEAANAIARFVGGDIQTFVNQMNEVARMLGCENTNFTNPHGYHDERHQTTARDLAIIMDAAMENEMFRNIIGSYVYQLNATGENPARDITNSNLHIIPEDNYYYEFSIGGKTGFHSDAGYCLVEAAKKDGVELIAVALYSGKYSRWPDTSRLFQYGFTQYKSTTPEEIYARSPITLEIKGFDLSDSDLGRLKLTLNPVDPTREVRFTDLIENVDDIIENSADYTSTQWLVDLRAPIEKGEVMGTLTFYPPPPDDTPAVYELVAERSIAARVDSPPTLEEIEQRVAEDDSIFPPFGWDWVLPPILVAVAVIFLLRLLLKRLFRRRKHKSQVPKSKRRTFN